MGETIQSIGRKYNLPWQSIAEANELEYPWVDAEDINSDYKDNARVAKVGTTILIPTADTIAYTYNEEITNINEQVLGADLDIFSELWEDVHNMEDGGLLTDDLNGDLLIATGINNLRQQLLLKLQTEKGSLALHPDFGTNLVRYIGSRITQELLTKIALEIRKAIISDPRVKSMSDITMYHEGSTIQASFVVYPIEPYTPFSLEPTMNL